MISQEVYRKLVDIARAQRTITYAEVAEKAYLDMSLPADRNAMSELLDEISVHEHKQRRPLLSAVVVRGDTEGGGIPGQGFFKLAIRLGLYLPHDDVAFFAKELIRVHEYWKAHPDTPPLY